MADPPQQPKREDPENCREYGLQQCGKNSTLCQLPKSRNYQTGERRNDVYARMRMIAPRLTDAEMTGLARYYRAGFR